MSLSDITVYNDDIYLASIELLDQMIANIAASSNGAIQLTSLANGGDFSLASQWANLSAAQRRVDRYAANGAQASTALASQEFVSVKVAGGFGPVLLEPAMMTWIRRQPAEAIAAISQGFAASMMQDQLNSGIAAAVAAIRNQAGLVNDAGAGVVTQTVINGAHALFGDHSQLLVADIMTGTTYHKLVAQGLTNSSQLFQAGNVTIVDILGKAVVITDAPALTDVTDDVVLSLVAGGLSVSDNGDVVTNIETTNNKERIETTFQADYTFQLGLKGYAWDIANGGKSPTDAEIATGGNWDPVSAAKLSAGVLAQGATA